MNFLCDHHRQTVLQSPRMALSYWEQWLQISTDHIDNQQWGQATDYLGCCFEVAEWLLDQPQAVSTEKLPHIDRYMVSGHYLAESLGRSQQPEQELHFLLTVHTCLVNYVREKRQQYWLLRTHLEISLSMICRYKQQRGVFKGFYDCCQETQFYLKQCTH